MRKKNGRAKGSMAEILLKKIRRKKKKKDKRK
jgi:hypothetical protein